MPAAQKLKFRDRSPDGLSEAFNKKERQLRATWTNRLDAQMASTPPFDNVYRSVRQSMRSADLFADVKVSRAALGL